MFILINSLFHGDCFHCYWILRYFTKKLCCGRGRAQWPVWSAATIGNPARACCGCLEPGCWKQSSGPDKTQHAQFFYLVVVHELWEDKAYHLWPLSSYDHLNHGSTNGWPDDLRWCQQPATSKHAVEIPRKKPPSFFMGESSHFSWWDFMTLWLFNLVIATGW